MKLKEKEKKIESVFKNSIFIKDQDEKNGSQQKSDKKREIEIAKVSPICKNLFGTPTPGYITG